MQKEKYDVTNPEEVAAMVLELLDISGIEFCVFQLALLRLRSEQRNGAIQEDGVPVAP